MNANPMNENGEQAAASRRIRMLRKSWHRWQSDLLLGAMVVVCQFFLSTALAREPWVLAVFVGAWIGLSVLNQRSREKAWREVVQKEAPELYHRIFEAR